ncbi:nucleotide-diphospho-sugar transferase [Mycena haematopus]|nr:nucleotide-diphospho-sugar transferase [Mycena haematopus]
MEVNLPQGGIAATHVCACNPRKFPHYPADCNQPRPHGQLNSGTVVLEPSLELAKSLYHFLATDERVATWSFPDQDLLTAFFHGKWTSLPWYYNALRTLRTIHPQMWDDDVARCVHYILADKPWQVKLEDSKEFEVVNSWWWAHYTKVNEKLRTEDIDGWEIVSAVVVS